MIPEPSAGFVPSLRYGRTLPAPRHLTAAPELFRGTGAIPSRRPTSRRIPARNSSSGKRGRRASGAALRGVRRARGRRGAAREPSGSSGMSRSTPEGAEGRIWRCRRPTRGAANFGAAGQRGRAAAPARGCGPPSLSEGRRGRPAPVRPSHAHAPVLTEVVPAQQSGIL